MPEQQAAVRNVNYAELVAEGMASDNNDVKEAFSEVAATRKKNERLIVNMEKQKVLARQAQERLV